MFKNAMAFKIDSPETAEMFRSTSELIEVMDFLPSMAPHKTQWRSWGFTHPPQFGEQILYTGAMGVRLFSIGMQERLLPGAVTQQAVKLRVKKLEELEDRKVSRKEAAQFKDDEIAKLLPKAFVKQHSTLVMVKGDWVIIDTSSTKTAEDVISFMRDAFHEIGPMNLIPLGSYGNSKDWLRGVALNEADLEEESFFRHLDAATLKGEGVIRLKDTPFSTEEAQKAILNCTAIKELAMAWSRDVGETDMQFSVSDSLVIKRLKFSDILLAQAESDSEGAEDITMHFDATLAIVSDLLEKLVSDIHVACFTGEQEDGETSKTPHVDDFDEGGENDPMFMTALEEIMESAFEKITISWLQRKLRTGYNRTVRLLEAMEDLRLLYTVDTSGTRRVDSIRLASYIFNKTIAKSREALKPKEPTLAERLAAMDAAMSEGDDEI